MRGGLFRKFGKAVSRWVWGTSVVEVRAKMWGGEAEEGTMMPLNHQYLFAMLACSQPACRFCGCHPACLCRP